MSPGPVPKQPERRARANPPARGDWVLLPAEPYAGDRAAMPTKLLKASRETWERWWTSPQAHMWTPTQWQAVRRAIRLVDREERGMATGEDRRELRQLEDALGLSLKGLQDRRWLLPFDASTEGDRHLAPVTDISSRERPDPRDRDRNRRKKK